jgi:hypothetical protein
MAASYVASPAALGRVAADPARGRDRLSATYAIALAARVIREVSQLFNLSRKMGKHLATLSIDTEIRFRSAEERAAFSGELTQAITELAARYHDASAPGGRLHRLVVVSHPLPRNLQARRVVMSIKKDETGRRWVQAEVEVPGSPEEVRAAVAIAEGVSSWFVPTEKRAAGTVVSHFGPRMGAIALESAWEPPRRFAAESELGPGAPTVATEWIVEAKAGGTCVVRVVHSLFASSADWDDQLEGVEAGWADYFEILRLYLTHFRGQRSSGFSFSPWPPSPRPLPGAYSHARWDLSMRRLASIAGRRTARRAWRDMSSAAARPGTCGSSCCASMSRAQALRTSSPWPWAGWSSYRSAFICMAMPRPWSPGRANRSGVPG